MKTHHRLLFCLFCLFCLAPSFLRSQEVVLAQYSFAALTGTEPKLAPLAKPPPPEGFKISPLVRGRGLNNLALMKGIFAAHNWTTGDKESSTHYIEFEIRPGKEGMGLRRIDFDEYGNANGPEMFTVRSSLDGFKADLIGPLKCNLDGTAKRRVLRLGAEFSELRQPVTFRFYAWKARNRGNGVWGLGIPDGKGVLSIRGTAKATPAPAKPAPAAAGSAEFPLGESAKKNLGVPRTAAPVAGDLNKTPFIYFNDDGDFTFIGENETEWRANLKKMLAPLPRTPVNGLIYSLATGTDVLLYPSKAGSSWGWSSLEVGEKFKHIRHFPRAVQAGLDGVRWAADDAKELGVGFVPAFRMNDAHYASPGFTHLEGRFWRENKHLTFGTPPIPSDSLKTYKDLLDFTHAEVRRHRLEVIREAIERYADTMDGFALDFMRTPAYFTPETAVEKAPLMTELVAEVRRALTEAEARAGKPLPLIVRVPPTLKNCKKTGLDVETWMRRGLVQIVIPSQSMVVAQDTPLREFIDAARPAGVRVFASIFGRTAHTCAFVKHAPLPSDYIGRSPSPEVLRAAALNYRAMAADGIEFYNFNLPLNNKHAEGVRAFSDPLGELLAKPRTYVVTASYFVDHLDAFEPPKQVPVKIKKAKRPLRLQIYIGENPGHIKDGAYCALRIGFADTVTQQSSLHVELNGIPFASIKTDGEVSQPKIKQGPAAYWQIPIANPREALIQGWNDLAIECSDPASLPRTIMEIQIGVLPW